MLHQSPHFPSRLSRQSDPGQSQFLSCFQRSQNVGGIAGGGDAEHQVSRFGMSLQLTGKHQFISEIIGDGG